MKKITITLAILFSAIVGFSQIGSSCATPYLVSSLPFNLSATTDSTGNNYSGICSSTYSDENTFLFEFTPATDIYINAELTNTAIYVGLFITEGCPDIGTCVDFNEAQFGNPLLNNIYLQGGITYYIIISNNDPLGMGFAISTAFTIDINEVSPFDASVVEITGIESGCSLSSTQVITAEILNNGADSLYNFDIAYSLSGGAEVIENITDTILPSDTLAYIFTSTIDISTQGFYGLDVYTLVVNDADNLNDTAHIDIMSSPVISTFPHLDDFETLPSWWSAQGTSPSWEIGTPAATIINSAFSGVNSWVTNLTGFSNALEQSQLISPCFDFTSLTKPIIEFELQYSTTIIVSTVTFEYTIDNGTTWQTLSTGSAESNWDNPWSGESTGWIHVSNTVPYLAGESNVKFRFSFTSLQADMEGVAIDDFAISNCDLADPTADFSYTINGASVTFTNNSTGATSYYWDFGDLQNSTDENPVHDYFAITNSYTVILIVQNECGSDTSYQIVDIVVSLEEIIGTNNIIYPNPANDVLYLSYELSKGLSGQLDIYNMQGEKVNSIMLKTGTKFMTINKHKLNSGMYIYKFVIDNNIISDGKLIIIK